MAGFKAFLLLSVCMFIRPYESCTCFRNSLTWDYCTADFVIKVKVVKEFDPMYKGLYKLPNDIPTIVMNEIKEQYAVYQYAFDVIAVLRGSHAYESARQVLQTFGSDAMCGFRFKEGGVYIIAGHAEEDAAPTNALVLGVNSCNLVLRADGADVEIVKGLEKNPPNCHKSTMYMSNVEKQALFDD